MLENLPAHSRISHYLVTCSSSENLSQASFREPEQPPPSTRLDKQFYCSLNVTGELASLEVPKPRELGLLAFLTFCPSLAVADPNEKPQLVH